MPKIEFNGETRTVADWARLNGMSKETLGKRLKLGWSIEEALTKPVGPQARKAAPPPLSFAQAVPALVHWQRDMHAAHRQMTRSVRAILRQMEEQMAELRHGLDQQLAAQRDEALRHAAATPGVGQNSQEIVRDRCCRVAQESR